MPVIAIVGAGPGNQSLRRKKGTSPGGNGRGRHMLASLNDAIDVQLKSVLIATDFSAASEKALAMRWRSPAPPTQSFTSCT